MSELYCPRCGDVDPRRLEGCSAIGAAVYYVCLRCAHLWAVAKDGSNAVHHITPLEWEVPDGFNDTSGLDPALGGAD